MPWLTIRCLFALAPLQFLKNVSLTIRQRKSLILFCILAVILMIIPPIIIHVLPMDDNDYYYDNSFNSGNGFACDVMNGGYSNYLPRLLVVDDTNKFGNLSSDRWQMNNNLYKGLIGWLGQATNSFNYGGESWCTTPPGNYPSGYYAAPYTVSYQSATTMLSDFRNVLRDAVCYYYQYLGAVHIKDLQTDDLTKQIKIKADSWETRVSSTRIPCNAFALETATLAKVTNFSYSFSDLASQYPIYRAPLPGIDVFYSTDSNHNVEHPKNGFGLTFYWIFSMLVLSFLTPMFTQRPVLERSDGLVDLSMMMGLSRLAHWLGHLTLDFLIYLVIYILILVVAAASASFAILAMIQPWVLFGCLFYGVTSIYTAYLISFIFRSPRAALVMSYIFALVQFGIAAVFNMLLTSDTSNLPALLMVWPPFNFFRLTYIGLLASSYPNHHSEYTPILRDSFIALVGETIILVAVVFALDRWMPTKLGHRGSTLNLITDGLLDALRIIKSKCCGRSASKTSMGDDGDAEDFDPLLEGDNDHYVLGSHIKTDPRVEEERKAVVGGKTDDAVMVIREVRKIYAEGSKRFTALGGISFALREGDCFGLLGPNGAGKSTLVAIMSGILSATSGSVTVAKSHDRCAIGLCPQDDIFYADLTVEEHLLYYSRLKGKGRYEDQLAVDTILADVSMQNERRLRASSLSGGQKRRLSVASALCGDPMVVFLDEPSSSLDPGSRIGLWEIIQSVSKSRCTLLTTHSMDEAEVLCNRIGIIKDGHMVCLGSSSQLKNLYGEGYKLELTLNPGVDVNAEILPTLCTDVAPGALVVSRKYGHVSIQLGRDALLSQVTQLLESNKKKFGITRWSLARNGLDEVFLSIVEDRGASKAPNTLNHNADATLNPDV